MTSFLYPRTITITRPNTTSAIGNVGYRGATMTNENTLAQGVSANIELVGGGRNTSSSGLPGDSPGPIKWKIMLPASVLSDLPQVQERDVIYDDMGRRFQVDGYQPSAIGAQIDAVRLTA